MQKNKQQQQATKLDSLKTQLFPQLQYAMTIVQEKGPSCWLTALPADKFGFALHKEAFALALCYGWPPNYSPSHCACGVAIFYYTCPLLS